MRSYQDLTFLTRITRFAVVCGTAAIVVFNFLAAAVGGHGGWGAGLALGAVLSVCFPVVLLSIVIFLVWGFQAMANARTLAGGGTSPSILHGLNWQAWAATSVASVVLEAVSFSLWSGNTAQDGSIAFIASSVLLAVAAGLLIRLMGRLSTRQREAAGNLSSAPAKPGGVIPPNTGAVHSFYVFWCVYLGWFVASRLVLSLLGHSLSLDYAVLRLIPAGDVIFDCVQLMLLSSLARELATSSAGSRLRVAFRCFVAVFVLLLIRDLPTFSPLPRVMDYLPRALQGALATGVRGAYGWMLWSALTSLTGDSFVKRWSQPFAALIGAQVLLSMAHGVAATALSATSPWLDYFLAAAVDVLLVVALSRTVRALASPPVVLSSAQLPGR